MEERRLPWSDELLAWYEECKRDLPFRRDREAYHIWVSEIMAQQTRIEALIKYYIRFINRYPKLADVAASSLEELYKLWEGLGYYSRARNLHQTAGICMERYGGELPHTYEELLTLPGIGSYTAAAISSISYGERKSAVDGNVLRVLTRMQEDGRDVLAPKLKQLYHEWLNRCMPEDRPGDFNQAMMELGAMICIPNGNPRCNICPVQRYCQGYQHGTMLQYPYKKAKKPRRIEVHAVYLIEQNGRFGIQKRPDDGLLGGLYEFFHVLVKDNDTITEQPWMVYRHIFSHVEWEMRVYRVTDYPDFHGIFATRQEIAEIYPIAHAFEPIKQWIIREGR